MPTKKRRANPPALSAARVAARLRAFKVPVRGYKEGDYTVDGEVDISEWVHVQVPSEGGSWLMVGAWTSPEKKSIRFWPARMNYVEVIHDIRQALSKTASFRAFSARRPRLKPRLARNSFQTMYLPKGRDPLVGWIITKDHIAMSGERNAVGLMGPGRTAVKREWLLAHGRAFRLLDDDGEVYYEGKWNGLESGEADAFGPLNDFGMPNAGATMLQYWDNGWKQL